MKNSAETQKRCFGLTLLKVLKNLVQFKFPAKLVYGRNKVWPSSKVSGWSLKIGSNFYSETECIFMCPHRSLAAMATRSARRQGYSAAHFFTNEGRLHALRYLLLGARLKFSNDNLYFGAKLIPKWSL